MSRTARAYDRRLWRRLRLAVLARDGARCYRCGAPAREVDHVVPLALGGAPFDPRNLRAACGTCNARTGGQVGRQVQRLGRPSRRW